MRLEAIAMRLEAIHISLEAINSTSRLEAAIRLEAIDSRLEAIDIRLEVIALRPLNLLLLFLKYRAWTAILYLRSVRGAEFIEAAGSFRHLSSVILAWIYIIYVICS